MHDLLVRDAWAVIRERCFDLLPEPVVPILLRLGTFGRSFEMRTSQTNDVDVIAIVAAMGNGGHTGMFL